MKVNKYIYYVTAILTILVILLFFSVTAVKSDTGKTKETKTGEVIMAEEEDNNIAMPENYILNDTQTGLSSAWYREMPNESYSGSITDKYIQAGSPSYRIELRKTDVDVNKGKRSEISTFETELPLQESTYTFYILLPKGGVEDYAIDPLGSEIIAQWHNTPDEGEEWTTPPLALRTKEGRYVLERCWDDSEITTDEQITKKGYRSFHDLGSYVNDKGRYVKWSFHIKWGWLESQEPMLEVYKDGVKVLDLNGLPNTTNDKKGVRLKLGIYKWDWGQGSETNYSILDKRVIYYNNVSIRPHV